MATTPKLNLVTTWTPARDGKPLAYGIELTNNGDAPLRDFKLGVNGPARIDTKAEIEGAALVERLSNHTLLAPPAGFVLEPGATWVITVRGLSYPLRHWSDGTNTAYVALADGSTVRVATEPTDASITPVMPPSTKVNRKPRMKSIGTASRGREPQIDALLRHNGMTANA